VTPSVYSLQTAPSVYSRCCTTTRYEHDRQPTKKSFKHASGDPTEMTDKRDIHAYVDPAVADEVTARAEANDESVSSWIAGAIEQRLEEDRLGDSADRYEVERRLERVVDRAADRAADRIVDRIEDADSSPSTESDEFAAKAQEWGDSD